MTVKRFLEIANGAEGLCAADAAFRALVGPGETEAQQKLLAQKSTCALFVRGCLAKTLGEMYRQFASDGTIPDSQAHPLKFIPRSLLPPYVDRTAASGLVEVLHRAGREPGRIVRGSVVIVGEGISTHVFIVHSVEVDRYAGGPYDLTTIEAGQRNKDGLQCVVRRRHQIVDGIDRAYYIPERTDGIHLVPASSARPVTHVLDVRPLLEPA